MSRLPALIVGAGPTGLMMACELARHHIPFRIIDKKPEPAQGSNATWIQTRTLEIFDAIGIADDFLKLGHKCDAINFYVSGKALTSIPLNHIDSCYPFILMLPQSETERLLTKKLDESKIRVERSLELINAQQTDNGVVATIRLADGNTENITSDWIIACDGANSTVRQKCQIPFPGEDIAEQFMVADARMSSSFLPTNEIHVFFDKGTILPEKSTIFGAFPWGSKEYRLNANLYLSHARQTFTPHEVKEIVAERTFGNYIVESVSWISPFWIHSQIVDHMQQGSIFLAGDAAHIHSPAGGQGMNTGIQDAYNLAWKLALVIHGKANPTLLQSYQLERYPVVDKIVEQTDDLTKMMLFDKSFFTKLSKFSKSVSHASVAKKVGMELTQLDIQYQDSPIIDYHEKTSAKSPKQGERAPNVILDNTTQLYDHFRNAQHNILLFSGKTPKKDQLSELVDLQQKISQTFPGLIQTHIVSTENSKEIKHFILDLNTAIHNRYDISHSAIYLIRPDNTIAYYSKKLDMGLLEKFLIQYLEK